MHRANPVQSRQPLQRSRARQRRNRSRSTVEQAARPASWRSAHPPGGSEKESNSSCQIGSSSGTLFANMKTKAQRKSSGPRFLAAEQVPGLAGGSMPNPSIERTRTGRPRYARSSFSAPRGLPVRAAHVKR